MTRPRSAKSANSDDDKSRADDDGGQLGHSLQRSAKIVPDDILRANDNDDKMPFFNATRKPSGYVAAVREMFANRKDAVNIIVTDINDSDHVRFEDEDEGGRRSADKRRKNRPKRHTRIYNADR